MSSLPTVIAGPCSMESLEVMRTVAAQMSEITFDLGFNYIFKSSFKKANRSSGSSYRGPGIEQGKDWLNSIAHEFKCQVTTDIHEVADATFLAETVDVLQIPALLSRQTELIEAAGRTGRVVNIKRGQFMAPWKVQLAADKAIRAGAADVIITERGSMNGYDDLIVDFRTLVEARKFGLKAGFDATHSVQKPTLLDTSSGGNPEYIEHFARAAAVIGVDYLFFETHPNPSGALSDGTCMIPLNRMRETLESIRVICSVFAT